MNPIDLPLGRPSEPVPRIAGPDTFPDDVLAGLAADAATIIARYPQPRSALLPLLHLAQSVDGYLTDAGIRFCAQQLGLTDAEVTAVAVPVFGAGLDSTAIGKVLLVLGQWRTDSLRTLFFTHSRRGSYMGWNLVNSAAPLTRWRPPAKTTRHGAAAHRWNTR